jgi:hypothetical protein
MWHPILPNGEYRAKVDTDSGSGLLISPRS